ncbi:MAG: hypothetical protein WCG03_11630 [Kiritimatiellales bacterium]
MIFEKVFKSVCQIFYYKLKNDQKEFGGKKSDNGKGLRNWSGGGRANFNSRYAGAYIDFKNSGARVSADSGQILPLNPKQWNLVN